MLNIKDALLNAIADSPDDDLPRLVYADWLDDHGESGRAEFIRTQIQREGFAEGDPKRTALAAREQDLAFRHAADWLRALPEWARPQTLIASDSDWFGLRRGFLQGVVVSNVNDFLKDAPTIFALEPVTHLYLGSGLEGAFRQFAGCPGFLRLTGLHFGHYALGDEGAIELSWLPPMPRLRELWLYKNRIGDRGLKALAKWPGLATVQDLELGFNDFHAPGIRALIASPYLTSLKRLDLRDSLIARNTKKALQDRFGEVVEV